MLTFLKRSGVALAMPRTSENPYSPAHWLGVVDTRPLALLRILLGLVLAEDFIGRFAEVRAFLTDDGFLPSGVTSALQWSFFNGTASPEVASALLAVAVFAALAFTVGFHTRVAAVVMWAFSISIQHRASIIQTGGDTIAAATLFFSSFTDLAARWSLDARRRGSRAQVHALVPRLLMYLPVALYLETARAKIGVSGAQWLNGPLIFQHLHLYGWVRPVGTWLREYPALCAALTTATIVTEFLIPLLFVLPFWVRPARLLAVVCHVGLQVGILLTLKVGAFTNVMLALTANWLLPEWLDLAAARLGDAGRWLRREGEATLAPGSALRAVPLAAVAVLYALSLLDPMAPTHMPRGTRPMLSWLGLDLKVGLFTKASPSQRWEAVGVLADGSATDPIRVVAPGALRDGDFFNNLWMQVPYRITDFSRFGPFVCRRFNATSGGAALRSWKLTKLSREPFAPNAPVPAEGRRLVLEQDCGGEGMTAVTR